MSEGILARRMGGLDITKMQLISVFALETNTLISTANIPSDYDIAVVSGSGGSVSSWGQFFGIYDQSGTALFEQSANVPSGYYLAPFFGTGQAPRGLVSHNISSGSTNTRACDITFFQK